MYRFTTASLMCLLMKADAGLIYPAVLNQDRPRPAPVPGARAGALDPLDALLRLAHEQPVEGSGGAYVRSG